MEVTLICNIIFFYEICEVNTLGFTRLSALRKSKSKYTLYFEKKIDIDFKITFLTQTTVYIQ